LRPASRVDIAIGWPAILILLIFSPKYFRADSFRCQLRQLPCHITFHFINIIFAITAIIIDISWLLTLFSLIIAATKAAAYFLPPATASLRQPITPAEAASCRQRRQLVISCYYYYILILTLILIFSLISYIIGHYHFHYFLLITPFLSPLTLVDIIDSFHFINIFIIDIAEFTLRQPIFHCRCRFRQPRAALLLAA